MPRAAGPPPAALLFRKAARYGLDSIDTRASPTDIATDFNVARIPLTRLTDKRFDLRLWNFDRSLETVRGRKKVAPYGAFFSERAGSAGKS
jgi:hypothetical protein